MSKRELPRPKLRLLAAMTLAVAVVVAAADAFAQSECLVKVKGTAGEVADQGTVCAEAQNKICIFQLQLCLNEADAQCAAATMKKKVKAKGKCGPVGKLQVKPDGSNAVCGSMVGIKVKTKKKGRREGTCNIRISARGKGKHAPRDVDKLKLVCKPNPGECPVTSVTPTTTIPPCIAPCPCCVLPITDLGSCITR
jgi:hypothetical protein